MKKYTFVLSISLAGVLLVAGGYALYTSLSENDESYRSTARQDNFFSSEDKDTVNADSASEPSRDASTVDGKVVSSTSTPPGSSLPWHSHLKSHLALGDEWRAATEYLSVSYDEFISDSEQRVTFTSEIGDCNPSNFVVNPDKMYIITCGGIEYPVMFYEYDKIGELTNGKEAIVFSISKTEEYDYRAQSYSEKW